MRTLNAKGWAVVGATFAATFFAGMVVAPHPELEPTQVEPSTVEREPIPITIRTPHYVSRPGRVQKRALERTLLGHTGRDATKLDRSFLGYELWIIVSDGEVEMEDDFPFCKFDAPIIERDYSGLPNSDGAYPEHLLGYRTYCGPRRYYTHGDCMRDAFDIGGDLLASGHRISRGYYNDQRQWIPYDRARFECREVVLDEYPVADAEWRDERKLAAARKPPPNPFHPL